MVLLAFSTEVGAGVALHEAERLSSNLGDSYEELQHAREAVRKTLAELAKETMELQNEPAQFVHKFWHDFHWALLKRAIATARVFTIGLLIASLFLPQVGRAQQRPLELVILVDLSRSVDTKGVDDRTEFEKNLEGVSKIMRQVPAGSHLSVVGITDDSFGQPYLLLSAAVGSDTGYFGEKLTVARQRLVAAWKQKSRTLNPSFPATDLFGAFLVASQIFQKACASRRDVLVVFSDMWQETGEFSFNGKSGPCQSESITTMKTRGLLADLRDVEVHALGADAHGRTKREWICAHEFWSKYFSETQGQLQNYSILRDLTLRR